MPTALLALVAATLVARPSDPGHHFPAPIARELFADRTLTDADVTLRGRVQAPDGTFWLGEADGPALLHVDAAGRLLEAPVLLPDPQLRGRTLASPRGYQEETSPQRLLNGLFTEVLAHGGKQPPICSPDSGMLIGVPGGGRKVFDVAAIQRRGFPVVPWTINDPARMKQLLGLGVAGLITDAPDLARGLLPAGNLGPDGLVAGFDLQGHRGARNLRPENTLPSFEAGLDALSTTLETDCHFTRDKVLVLSHDGALTPAKVRLASGGKLEHEVAIASLTHAELAAGYVADGLLPDRPEQRRDLALSPVAVAFAKQHGLAPYAMPTLDQLLDFVPFYEARQRALGTPEALRRAENAARVLFNLETKVRPIASGGEQPGDAAEMARAILAAVHAHRVDGRTSLESFDFRALLTAAREAPAVRLVALFEDDPEDGGNIAPVGGKPSPWLGGFGWAYRRTLAAPPRVETAGGIADLARDGNRLFVTLARPLRGESRVWIQVFDLRTRRWTGERWRYPLGTPGGRVAGLQLQGHGAATVHEADGRHYQIRFGPHETLAFRQRVMR